MTRVPFFFLQKVRPWQKMVTEIADRLSLNQLIVRSQPKRDVDSYITFSNEK